MWKAGCHIILWEREGLFIHVNCKWLLNTGCWCFLFDVMAKLCRLLMNMYYDDCGRSEVVHKSNKYARGDRAPCLAGRCCVGVFC